VTAVEITAAAPLTIFLTVRAAVSTTRPAKVDTARTIGATRVQDRFDDALDDVDGLGDDLLAEIPEVAQMEYPL